MNEQAPLIEIQDLVVHFPIRGGVLQRERGRVHAVDGVSLTLGRGETVGLVGESGSGKSTLGRALLRLVEITGGSITFDGIDVTELRWRHERQMRRRMQMIFQDPHGSLNPRMTVGATLTEPLRLHGLAHGTVAKERVAEMLRLVGLDQRFVDRYPYEFSGGQQQRIAIARALMVEPDFIVCDEPVSALDVSIQAQVLNLLANLRDRFNLSYLFIAHDLAVVRLFSDRIAVMYLGRIVEVSAADELYSRPAHPYSHALLSAIPVPDPDIERERKHIFLTGDPPSPVAPPSGCHFHPRCWLYNRLDQPEECRTVDPQLRLLDDSHSVACHFAERASTISP